MSRFLSKQFKLLTMYEAGEQLGDRYLKLNANESPYPPSPLINQVISSSKINQLKRYGDISYQALHEALANQLNLTVDNIVLGAGADDVLDLIFRTYFQPGDTLLLPNITYPFYETYANAYGYQVKEILVDDKLQIELLSYIESNEACVIVNPNAPSGHYHPISEIERVVQSNPDRLVIVDEAYIDFGGESAAPLVKKYDNLIVVQTFSKSRNLAGARIGYALAAPSLTEDLKKIRGTINPFYLSELQVLTALASLSDDAYFKQSTSQIMATRDHFSHQLQAAGFYVLPSLTNFVLVKPRHISASELYEALKAQHILVRYYTKPVINDYVRISIGLDHDMTRVLDTMLTLDQENHTSVLASVDRKLA